jgi:DNA-binding MarR family transcriptional regulator
MADIFPRDAADEGIPALSSATDEQEEFGTGHLDHLVGYHIRRASGVFLNDFARTLADLGIRQVQFGILSVIAANPGINQGNAGKSLGIQRANMVGLVNELVDRDLVERVTAEDRRAFSLSLTKAGKAIVAKCLDRIHAHEDRLLSDLSDAERAQLIELLRRIEAKQ